MQLVQLDKKNLKNVLHMMLNQRSVEQVELTDMMPKDMVHLDCHIYFGSLKCDVVKVTGARGYQ